MINIFYALLVSAIIGNINDIKHNHPYYINGEVVSKSKYFKNINRFPKNNLDIKNINFKNQLDRDEIIINFDDIDVPCSFDVSYPLSDEYSNLGITFEGLDGEDGGYILNECGNFNVTGYSPPNFLAFNTIFTGLIQKISFINENPNYVALSAGSPNDGTLRMSAYSSLDTLLEISEVINDTNVLDTLSISTSDIAYVIIEFVNSSNDFYTAYVIDDLIFSLNNAVLGDLNEDGQINVIDVVVLINLVFDNNYNEQGDINGDGILNILDCILLVDLILGN